MRNDNSTVATQETLDSTTATQETLETESFQHVHGNPLSLTAFPRFDSIGLDAFSGDNTKVTSTEFCFSLQAGELPESEEARAPVDIIVALDRSGSMFDRGKLDLCKKTLGLLLHQLRPQDRFGLITYDFDAEVAIPVQRMTPEHKATASQVIESIHSDGGTNISSAVGLSVQEMRAIDDPNPVQTVFLLTDGLANNGICNTKELADLVRNCYTDGLTLDPELFMQQRPRRGRGGRNPVAKVFGKTKQPSGRHSAISLHTFGYGADHNASLLREMASATEGGSYYFIEEDKDVGSAFGDALGGVLSVVAQNAMIILDVPVAAKALGVIIEKVHHDKAVHRENGSYTVNLGDFYAEETRDLVVTVTLATPQEPTAEPIPHTTASLSYTDTVGARLVQGDTVVVSVARPSGGQLGEENSHVAAQFFRVYVAKEMEEAEELASAGQYQEAKAKFVGMKIAYQECSAAVQSTAQATELFQDADEMEFAMDDSAGVSSTNLARLNTKSRAHKTQRAAVSSASAAEPIAYKRSKQRAAYSSKCALK